MNNQPILFFDSGIGGLPYLEWLQKQEPDESILYYADTFNFPYGDKDRDIVREIIPNAIEKLIRRENPKMAVIACNTASVIALQVLRERFSIPFVGTVPAIKTAALGPEARCIGLLATSRTVSDVYTEKLIQDFAPHCQIVRQAAGDLVNFVEKRYFSSGSEEKREVVKPYVYYFKEKKIDALVLGCTHFIFLKAEFESLLGPGIRVVDSVEGVGRQILRILDQTGKAEGKDLKKDFYITGNTESDVHYADFARNFGLIYRGQFK